ncbi:hypothetical protein BH24ACI5_BH24ACI5_10800 [soil metagenome]
MFAVHFDGREVREARRQPQRQRAGAGSDLEEAVRRLRLDGRDQLVGPGRLEKIWPNRLRARTTAAMVQCVPPVDLARRVGVIR